LKKAQTAHILSDRITIEYVLEKLSRGFPHPVINPGGSGVTFSLGADASAIIFSPELSIFITASHSTLPILADLWDSREGNFDYGTRGKGSILINSPCISMLAGSTSEWLVASIPSNAVGGGFTRRVNFVYGKDRNKSIPWPVQSTVGPDLISDLSHISGLQGEFKFSNNAKPVFEKYYDKSGIVDEFDDEVIAAYKSSKWAHATKLAMVLSLCRSDSLEIDRLDFEEAVAMVDQCGNDLGMVFRAVGDSDLVSAADRVLRFIEIKGYASREEILAANWRHISSGDLDIVIKTLEEGRVLYSTMVGNNVIYKARPLASSAKP
jgi:hypothetical protein